MRLCLFKATFTFARKTYLNSTRPGGYGFCSYLNTPNFIRSTLHHISVVQHHFRCIEKARVNLDVLVNKDGPIKQ